MKVIIYARVSTDDQNVDQMAENCKKYADSQGWEVVWTFKDKESGTVGLQNRKVFKKIINTVKGEKEDIYNFEFDAVLVQAIDRLSRDWTDELPIEKAFTNSKYTLLSTREPIDFNKEDGKFLFRFYFALACKEVGTMKERQKIGIARAKAEGKYKGRKKGSKNKKK